MYNFVEETPGFDLAAYQAAFFAEVFGEEASSYLSMVEGQTSDKLNNIAWKLAKITLIFNRFYNVIPLSFK